MPRRQDPEPPPAPAGPAAPLSRAILGAVLGGALGTAAWGLFASATGWGTGAPALLVGALAGLGSRLSRGRGFPAAAAAVVVAMAFVFLGQGWAARGGIERDLERDLALVDRAHYDEFAAAAADWSPRLHGDEIAKFAYRHDFVAMNDMGGIQAALREFTRTTVPRLEAWKRKAPPFEEWQAERREEIRRDSSPWGKYLASPLAYIGPLDLLCWLLAGAAAARIASVRQAPAFARKNRGEPGTTGPTAPPSGAPPPGSDPPGPRS